MMVINPWQTLSVCEKPSTMWDFVLWQKLRAVNGRTCVCFLFLFLLWFRTWKQDRVGTTPRTPRGTQLRRKKSHVCVLYQRNGGGSRSWPVGGGRACRRPPVWLNCPSGRPTPAASQKHHWQRKKKQWQEVRFQLLRSETRQSKKRQQEVETPNPKIKASSLINRSKFFT